MQATAWTWCTALGLILLLGVTLLGCAEPIGPVEAGEEENDG